VPPLDRPTRLLKPRGQQAAKANTQALTIEGQEGFGGASETSFCRAARFYGYIVFLSQIIAVLSQAEIDVLANRGG